MTAKRGQQVLLVTSMLWLSWLLMMLVHECGHVLGALATGGTVQRVIWHPAVISRTDVDPNPKPLIEVSAGPIVGCVIALMLAGIASALRWGIAYLVWMFAGFCLIANGAYVGLGAFDPVGDARELVALGVPRWMLGAVGLPVTIAGFAIWHRVSAHFGFGRSPRSIEHVHAYAVGLAAMVWTVIAFALGNAGR